MSGLGLIGLYPGSKWENWVDQLDVVAEVLAADRTREVIDTERLSALQHSKTDERPSVREIAGQVVGVHQVRKREEIIEGDDVCPVEVRGRVRAAQIAGIVAGEEESHIALLVESVRVGVGGAHLNPVAHAFFNVNLQ